jgi:hypothetical protein
MQNSEDIEILKNLSDWQIARLIMERIWHRYDMYEISYSQSLRADLLETIVFNTEKPPEGEFGIELEFLIDEAQKRKSIGEPKQLILNLGLAGLPLHHFFCFVIREIDRWYEKYTSNQPDSALMCECEGRIFRIPMLKCERKKIGALFSLMQVNEHLRQFDEMGITYSADELLKEGRNINYVLNDCSRPDSIMLFK